MKLSKRHRELLEQAHDEHEGKVNGGVPARHLYGDLEVGELIVAGLMTFHPPGRRPTLLIPTPLGRERVIALRERSKRSKRAAKKRKRQPGQ